MELEDEFELLLLLEFELLFEDELLLELELELLLELELELELEFELELDDELPATCISPDLPREAFSTRSMEVSSSVTRPTRAPASVSTLAVATDTPPKTMAPAETALSIFFIVDMLIPVATPFWLKVAKTERLPEWKNRLNGLPLVRIGRLTIRHDNEGPARLFPKT